MNSDDRWHGRIEALVEEHQRRLDTVNGQLDGISEKVASLAAKVAGAAAVAALIGSGVVSFLVLYFSGRPEPQPAPVLPPARAPALLPDDQNAGGSPPHPPLIK